MTIRNRAEENQTTARARQNVVLEPKGFYVLRRLANLLPKSLHFSNGGVHPLLMRQLYNGLLTKKSSEVSDADVDRQVSRLFYLRSYVRELPTALQAFVFYDQDLRYEGAGALMPSIETNEMQILRNFDLLDESARRLGKIVKEAEDRISIETHRARNPADGLPQTKLKMSSKALPISPPPAYTIGKHNYQEVGLKILVDRATQRFYFILAAEQLLDALTSPDPENELNAGWYDQEAGAARGWLLLDRRGRVIQKPPLLFSLLDGLQARRVRRCENCAHYFWAGRTNKRVCSETCGATSRKRTQRKRNLEIKLGDRTPKKRVNRFVASEGKAETT